MKKFKMLSLLLASGAFLTACSSTGSEVSVKSSGSGKTETTTKVPEKAKYEIKDIKVENDGFAVYVSGVLTNNTDSEKSYVQINIPAYDTAGNKVGDAFANVNNLKAKGTWKFKAMYLGSDKNVTFKTEEVEVTEF